MNQVDIIRDFGTNYISIPSNILQDKNISCKARGLYVTIMGLPRDLNLSIIGLNAILKESKNTIYTLLRELEEYGYVTRSQSKTEKGKFRSVVYTLHACSTRNVEECNVLTTEKQFSSCDYHTKEKIKHKSLSIDDRAKEFYDTLAQYIDNHYTKDMVESFFDYWSEPNPSRTKMRFELQKTWDVKRRLATWNRNNSKYGWKYNNDSRAMQRDIEKERRASEARNTIVKMLSEGDKSEECI